MRAVGVIVEYNPFHNGHLLHLSKSKQITDSEAVVAVMSGNFLQRGEPAFADKWLRTEAALHNGCDLVIELPVAYSTQAAEWFAYGAVALLEATGAVDSFCFGTESGSLTELQLAANIAASEPDSFKQLLYKALKDGLSYPSAFSSSIKQFLLQEGHTIAAEFPFAEPNHTLGLHYLIACSRIGGVMKPYTITREKAHYNDAYVHDHSIASATAVRKILLDSKNIAAAAPYIPQATLQLLARQQNEEQGPLHWEHFFHPLMHRILSSSAHQLAEVHEMTEGLEHRIINQIQSNTPASFEQLLTALKTKRYTTTKLQRALLSILLHHQKNDFTAASLKSGIQYIRVLGFTANGQKLLHRMKKTASLPILLSASKAALPYRYLQLDVQASNIYELAKPVARSVPQLFRDFKEKPVMI